MYKYRFFLLLGLCIFPGSLMYISYVFLRDMHEAYWFLQLLQFSGALVIYLVFEPPAEVYDLLQETNESRCILHLKKLTILQLLLLHRIVKTKHLEEFEKKVIERINKKLPGTSVNEKCLYIIENAYIYNPTSGYDNKKLIPKAKLTNKFLYLSDEFRGIGASLIMIKDIKTISYVTISPNTNNEEKALKICFRKSFSKRAITIQSENIEKYKNEIDGLIMGNNL